MTVRIAMWSGPRNISTAMMRSWENRKDCSVIDEPFYAYYLQQTHSPHPMFEQVIASQPSDYIEVANNMRSGDCVTELQYQKHMTMHMLTDDFSWATSLQHCFLIRHPAEVVASYTNSRGVCSADDIGIIRQAEIYKQLSQLTGQAIPVVDSKDVLMAPENILRKVCQRLNVKFDKAMLSWPSGTRDSDGIWADHWYHTVEQSTGFAQYKDKNLQLSPQQQNVVEQVMPAYLFLHEKKIKPQ